MINNTQFRNFLHYVIGFTIMFVLAYLTKFHTFTDEEKIFGVPLLSFVISGIGGVVWEKYQLYKKQIKEIGWDDVLRTAIGGMLGGMLGTFLMY